MKCQRCGREFPDWEVPEHTCLTIHGAMPWHNGKWGILFEWWQKGEYCDECQRLLNDALENAIPVPERYDKDFHDDAQAIKRETALMNEFANRREEEQ